MSEINFYHCDDIVANSIAPLMLKVIGENKKSLIYTQTAQIKEIDNILWGYNKNKFIPHVTIFDKEFEFKRQSIVITDKEENVNEADYLVITSPASPDFLKTFSRVFYFYDSLGANQASELKNQAGKLFEKVNSYKKENGKWTRG